MLLDCAKIVLMADSYIIFECSGDLARNILATAVVSSIKKAYPDRKIVVVTLFPEVWLHNPHVYRFYTIGKLAYFYDDYVNGKDAIIFRHDPVTAEDFAYDRKHILEIWCDLCGVPYDGSLPSLHFTWREKEAVGKLTKSDKPLFFIQTNVSPVAPQVPEFWATDIPLDVAQQVVDRMTEKGFATIHLRSDLQPALRNAQTLMMDNRQTLCAISYSKARLFMDSYAMHAAAAFNLPSTVLWVAKNPKVIGYAHDTNIIATPDPEYGSFMKWYKEGYDITGAMLIYLREKGNLFDADKVVEEILKQQS